MPTLLQVSLWLAIGVILYTFLGYPLLIGLLTRWVHHPVQKSAITPQVTLLIPAYNEASVISRKIENSLAVDYPPQRLEIVVVTDGSDDGTVDIVRGYAEQGVRLCHQLQRQGKTAAINRVMPSVSGEIVVFSDANAMLERGSLRALVYNFSDPSVGGVAGEKRVIGGGEGLYWRYESFLKSCDSALSSVMGAAGELFAIRRRLFEPPPPDTLLDDFVISLRLVEAGWRVVYEPEAVVTEKPSPKLAGEWQRRARNTAGGFQAMRRLPGLLSPARGWVAWQYFSHRVLRWAITPFLLPMIYALNLLLLELPFYRLVFLAQTVFYAAALLGYVLARRDIQRGPLYAVFYFCFTNVAALAGFWRYVTGAQSVTWAKVR
jgi:cellulose synthase/poly-beta-1,6-N-acetylglucosamine synthase-like glycosyltransferase